MQLPTRSRIYQNHHLDSTRWDGIQLRPDDIVISTSYKAGTTWTQTIVGHLLFWGEEIPGSILSVSPWVDMRINPLDSVRETIEAQTHRRFLKSHLPLDGLPYREDLQYIYVGRDPRDVFMSLWNHYRNHTPEFFARMNDLPGRVGDPFPPCPSDVRDLWKSWITRGWFEWENDGYPYWSHLHHAKTWWAFRDLPNILFVHFADLLADLEGEVRRIAAVLEIEHSDDDFRDIAEAVHFKTVKKNPERIVGDMSHSFEGGASTFIHKGTNGRWRELLGDADLALYRQAMERTLPPDCARWLEVGGPIG